jgi:D-alanyl-D-alanine carboxypeptidase
MASRLVVKGQGLGVRVARITLACALSLVALIAIAPAQMAQAKPVQASIVVDARTGEIVSASNADTLTYPASLTKMMTMYLLFEAMQDGRVKLGDQITFSKFAAGQPATNLNVDAGDQISIETAILALVVRSANDVATAVAEHLGGTEAGFARLMTAKAQALGMPRTTFRNAHGLPDPKQKTTARDLATLSIALIRDFPQYYGYFSKTKFKYHGVNYAGHNRLLKSYKGYDGIKTGYIRLSGFNLASSAERDGRRLVVVVLGGSSPSTRDRKVADLLTDGFKKSNGTGLMLAAKAPASGKAPKVIEPQVADAAPAKKPSPQEPTVAKSLVPGAKPFVPNAPVVTAPAEIAPAEIAVVDNRAMDQIVADVMNSPQLASADGTIDVEAGSAVLTASGAPSMVPTLKPGTGKKTLVADAPAPDSQATTVVWKPEGSYGIQVGAYSKFNAAQNAAQVATQAEPGLLADARIIIDSQKMNNGGKVYRARVAGLTKADAQTACRNLKAKRTDCLVLKIDNPLAMGN